METTTFADMRIRAWTPEEIRELVTRAKEAGISQDSFARRYVGCTLTALQHWLSGRENRKPSDVSRHALTLAEYMLRNELEPMDMKGEK
jgi:DNA-binding transcriptional regulator YiaG